MKETTASWSAKLYVTCPECSEFQEIDFETIDDWPEVIGGVQSTRDLDYEHTCERRNKKFKVTDTEW